MSLLGIVEAGRRFRSGVQTPSGLTDEILERIIARNPELNAYYEVFTAEARASAAAATAELLAGRDRGPLHGVPIGVKDLFDVAGHVTTAGAHPGFHPAPARADAEVVRRLREAGAVLIGKTAMHEWAFGVSNRNPHFGPTRNPHDPARIPGGSSGGSAAALAAGLCLGALGSDTGGSIRLPAALCGVVGLKPTWGLVSAEGVVELAASLDHVGPMATNVEDAFLLLSAMSGFRRPAVPAALRILRGEGAFLEPALPGVAAITHAAAERLGAVASLDLGDLAAVWRANLTILLSEAAAFHERRFEEHRAWFGGNLPDRLADGLATRAVDYARARAVGRAFRERLEHALGDDGVLVVPATAEPATVIGDREGAALSRLMTSFTAPFNLAGVPVLSLPAGKLDGLPVGVQLVAAPGREALLFEAGRRLEASAA
jgi:aspartyl-tRNA(Asn)/glutamyl-tRNA(Gln) amidotransferase subunit A